MWHIFPSVKALVENIKMIALSNDSEFSGDRLHI